MSDGTTPIDDPRPLHEVMRDWQARHGLTYDSAAARLDMARSTYANALAGKPQRSARPLRALMTLVDDGRA